MMYFIYVGVNLDRYPINYYMTYKTHKSYSLIRKYPNRRYLPLRYCINFVFVSNYLPFLLASSALTFTSSSS